ELYITEYLFWTFASVICTIFCKYITNLDAFGLYFANTAMFIFLAVSQFDAIKQSQVKTYLVLIDCIILLMLILSFFMPSYVAIIIASTITAGLGVVIDK